LRGAAWDGDGRPANRFIRRIPERRISRGDSPVPLPGGSGSDRGSRGMTSCGCPQYLPPGLCGAMGAMGAAKRLSRPVPRRSSKLFEKMSLPGAPLRNRTVDLLLTINTAPCTERTSSSDSTGNRTDSTGSAGIPAAPFHDPFHARRRASSRGRNRASSRDSRSAMPADVAGRGPPARPPGHARNRRSHRGDDDGL
jgi:hypothetical protein